MVFLKYKESEEKDMATEIKKRNELEEKENIIKIFAIFRNN